MAVIALLNAKVTVNGIDMSSMVTKVELPVVVVDLVTTNFASLGWDARIGGLKKATVNVTFNQDFAAAQTDALLWPLLGTVVPMLVKATNAANSATNPEFQFAVLINNLDPIKGKVGDLLTQDITWPVSGVVTRAIV